MGLFDEFKQVVGETTKKSGGFFNEFKEDVVKEPENRIAPQLKPKNTVKTGIKYIPNTSIQAPSQKAPWETAVDTIKAGLGGLIEGSTKTDAGRAIPGLDSYKYNPSNIPQTAANIGGFVGELGRYINPAIAFGTGGLTQQNLLEQKKHQASQDIAYSKSPEEVQQALDVYKNADKAQGWAPTVRALEDVALSRLPLAFGKTLPQQIATGMGLGLGTGVGDELLRSGIENKPFDITDPTTLANIGLQTGLGAILPPVIRGTMGAKPWLTQNLFNKDRPVLLDNQGNVVKDVPAEGATVRPDQQLGFSNILDRLPEEGEFIIDPATGKIIPSTPELSQKYGFSNKPWVNENVGQQMGLQHKLDVPGKEGVPEILDPSNISSNVEPAVSSSVETPGQQNIFEQTNKPITKAQEILEQKASYLDNEQQALDDALASGEISEGQYRYESSLIEGDRKNLQNTQEFLNNSAYKDVDTLRQDFDEIQQTKQALEDQLNRGEITQSAFDAQLSKLQPFEEHMNRVLKAFDDGEVEHPLDLSAKQGPPVAEIPKKQLPFKQEAYDWAEDQLGKIGVNLDGLSRRKRAQLTNQYLNNAYNYATRTQPQEPIGLPGETPVEQTRNFLDFIKNKTNIRSLKDLNSLRVRLMLSGVESRIIRDPASTAISHAGNITADFLDALIRGKNPLKEFDFIAGLKGAKDETVSTFRKIKNEESLYNNDRLQLEGMLDDQPAVARNAITKIQDFLLNAPDRAVARFYLEGALNSGKSFDEALKYAKDRSWQTKEDRVLYQTLERMRNAVPGGRILYPFLKTPANIVADGADYLGGGVAKEVFNELTKILPEGEFKNALKELGFKETGANLDKLLNKTVKTSLGIGIGLTSMNMYEGGVLTLPGERDQEGNIDYGGSITVAGHKIPLVTLGTLAIPIVAGGMWQKQARDENKTAIDVIGEISPELADYIVNQMPFTGAQLEGLTQGKPLKTATNLIRPFTTPAFVTDIQNIIGTPQKETRSGNWFEDEVKNPLIGKYRQVNDKNMPVSTDPSKGNTIFREVGADNNGVQDYLYELHRKTGKDSFYPTKRPPTEIEVGGETIKLSTEEIANFGREESRMMLDTYSVALDNELFYELSEEDQASLLSTIKQDINTAIKIRDFGVEKEPTKLQRALINENEDAINGLVRKKLADKYKSIKKKEAKKGFFSEFY